MERDEILLEKYFAGTTSLEEERYLHREIFAKNSSVQGMAFIAKKHTLTAPKEIEKTAWNAIEHHEKQYKKMAWSKWALVASIALLLFLGIGYVTNQGQSEAEKEQLLQEALSMFNTSEEQAPVEEILYEDELLVISFKKE